MKVFRLEASVNDFRTLLPADEQLWSTGYLSFAGLPRRKDWHGLRAYVTNPIKPPADFMGFGSGTVAVSEEAAENSRTFFEMAGELLPVDIEDGGRCYLLNVTECFNALDKEATKWILGAKTQQPIQIEKYEFHANRLPESTIFKIPETVKGEILVSERTGEALDEFKAFYEQQGFTGLKFLQLWSA